MQFTRELESASGCQLESARFQLESTRFQPLSPSSDLLVSSLLLSTGSQLVPLRRGVGGERDLLQGTVGWRTFHQLVTPGTSTVHVTNPTPPGVTTQYFGTVKTPIDAGQNTDCPYGPRNPSDTPGSDAPPTPRTTRRRSCPSTWCARWRAWTSRGTSGRSRRPGGNPAQLESS
jgi:hypothetical protein